MRWCSLFSTVESIRDNQDDPCHRTRAALPILSGEQAYSIAIDCDITDLSECSDHVAQEYFVRHVATAQLSLSTQVLIVRRNLATSTGTSDCASPFQLSRTLAQCRIPEY